MVAILSNEAPDPSLAELIDYSIRMSALKQAGRSLIIPSGLIAATPANWSPDGDITPVDVDLWNSDSGDLEHPMTLSPIRDRDLKVLIDWFHHDNSGDIEADIWHYLRQLMPEPCWEDDPFDFLHEYL